MTMALSGHPYSRHQLSAVSSCRKKKQSTILLRCVVFTTTAFLFHSPTSMVEARMPRTSSKAGTPASAGRAVAAFVPRRPSSQILLLARYQKQDTTVHDVIVNIRGGGASIAEDDEVEVVNDMVEEEAESSDDEYDSEEEEEEEEEGTDVSNNEEEEEEEEEEEQQKVRQTSTSPLKSSILSKSSSQKETGELTTSKTIEYDTLLTPPAMQQLFISIGVMLLSNRIDILDTKAVRMARIAFLSYIIVVQLFLLYVRLKAKSTNDRTLVMISSPLASLLPAAVTGGGSGGMGGNSMVKSLADQVLSTQTTILEYDLKQAKQMNGSLLFPMIFNYFLHFKMKQVQPLIMQTATGMVNLVYSPLFQVYVLGRNLERPFKQPVNPMMDVLQKQQQEQDGEGEEDKSADVEDDMVDEIEGSEGEEEEGTDDEDDGDDEYDNSDDE